MGFLDKLFNFGNSEKDSDNSLETNAIRMGRYSDNNKTVEKTQKWYDAEDLYKEKKYFEAIEIFFDYLKDDLENNVILTKTGNEYTFDIYQGTKIVKGKITEKEVTAWVSLAKMEKASTPVMRRLLEMNFTLFYARYALKDDTLCMLFDTSIDIASPNKLYYGLKEIATKADKQDDLLVNDFATLQAVDNLHVEMFSDNEKEVKYKYFQFWIESTLKEIEDLNQDSFSGGIAYTLLALLYKIDFLITPEGKLLNELEKIIDLYWLNKENKTAVERNQLLKDGFQKLLAWEKEEVLKYFYRAKATFAVTVPKPHAVVADAIKAVLENMLWYKDNKHPNIANAVMEYGLSYCQYSYSLPNVTTDLFTLFMHINYPSFFQELGFYEKYYSHKQFDTQRINGKINKLILSNLDKYPLLKFNTESLSYNTLVDFNQSFLNQILQLNFENK